MKTVSVQTKLPKEDICFYDAEEAPFRIYGLIKDAGRFRRLPLSLAEKLNRHAGLLHACTAGGKVRFRTDSPYVAIHAEMVMYGLESFSVASSITSVAAFDIYTVDDGEHRHAGWFVPSRDPRRGYEALVALDTAASEYVFAPALDGGDGKAFENGDKKMREIVINFPMWSEVEKLYIGLSKDAAVEEGSAFVNEDPVVFYGSSITQGGSAPRPGLTYEEFLSRRFNMNYLNLGFSEGALGEDEIAEYIAKLPMSLFVYDYDYNAPSVEHLRATHEKMFLTIRRAQPNLPIIMMPRPKYDRFTPAERERAAIIKATYENAVARGDKNVYFLSSTELMAEARYDGLSDTCHPNPIGFRSMAKAVGDLIEKHGLLQK